ncbi:MAG TPA: sigma-70 family RNA polymerase sigma factor [Polyangiaceae bacterium]|nr:sigma-70 family RNA polymerase sigma factor [Polyangiaceae bacterium]
MKRDVPERVGAAAASADVAFLSDVALVEGLRLREPAAIHAFYDRYSSRVLRILHRLLGHERELADVHHDVFVRALQSIRSLKDADRLTPWLMGVAVFTARSTIQRRMRRRWLQFMAPEALPEPAAPAASNEASEALRATYVALEQLPVDARIAFVLRFIEGMELKEGAAACSVSLATFKRRLTLAEQRFTELARTSPVLRDWLEGGSRWGQQKIR